MAASEGDENGPPVYACSRHRPWRSRTGHGGRSSSPRRRRHLATREAGAHQCRWPNRSAVARRRRLQGRHLHADVPCRGLFWPARRSADRPAVPRPGAAAFLGRGRGWSLPRAAPHHAVELFHLPRQLVPMPSWERPHMMRAAAMSTTPYPRDLIGYGCNPPHAQWPNRARVAVQFVINYEEGGENCILHGDAASEAFLSEIVGAQPWPGQRHMNMESIYEFGSRAGFWRLWRMFTERKLPVTVFAIATAMARNAEAVAAMNEAGWEIASHGLKWIDY